MDSDTAGTLVASLHRTTFSVVAHDYDSNTCDDSRHSRAVSLPPTDFELRAFEKIRFEQESTEVLISNPTLRPKN